MSRLLRQLLEESDPLFSHKVTRLEKSAGNPSYDVRITADIMSIGKSKIAELGLDPVDTTGAELYAGLLSRIKDADDAFRAYLGHPASSDDATKKALELLRDIEPSRMTWALKLATLKKLFLANPPKNVMKAFHFQSVDSLLKRMDTREILLAARILEGKTWATKYKKQLSQCYTRDFEKARTEFIALHDARWLHVLETWQKKKGCSVISSKETACVGYAVMMGEGSFVHTIPLALHSMNEVALHGSFLKLHFVNPKIGQALVDAIDEGTLVHSSLSGLRVHWREIHRYFGGSTYAVEPSFTHLDSNDLGWIGIETALALRIPELSFWIGTDYIGVSYGEKKIISINLHDVAESYVLKLNFTTMSSTYLKRALRSELMARYLHAPSARALALKQFDISGITDENW